MPREKMYPDILSICKSCGKEFISRKSKSCNPYPKHCSLTCRGLARRKRVTKNCAACGKEFWTHECRTKRNGRGNAGEYCSKKCGYSVIRALVGRVQKNAQGYMMEIQPEHPRIKARLAKNPDCTNYKVLQHILVMEKHLGRFLLPGENIHHKNGIRDDNRIENLELWTKPQPAGQRLTDLQVENDKLKKQIEELKLKISSKQGD